MTVAFVFVNRTMNKPSLETFIFSYKKEPMELPSALLLSFLIKNKQLIFLQISCCLFHLILSLLLRPLSFD